jgi:N-methylhydantoinase A
VTDADVVLGKIDPGSFSDGRMKLDPKAAVDALRRDIGEPAGLTATLAARAVSEVVNENMAAAARAHLSEWGKDVEGRILIAFGGAAPLHACLLARKLKLDRIVIPRNPGVGSAVGFLLAPVGYEVVRSHYMTLSSLDPEAIAQLMAEMFVEAHAVVSEVAEPEVLDVGRKAYMRYLGQGYEIAVSLPDDVAAIRANDLRSEFESTYESLYGRIIPGLEVEILSWTLNLAESRKNNVQRVASGDESDVLERRRLVPSEKSCEMFDVIKGSQVEADCFERSELEAGDYVNGPALITEPQTTIVVGTGYTAGVTRQENLVITAESKLH